MITTINRAIAAKRASLAQDDKQKGFTLIELLVVVLIIGVLAAIAIPAFLSQREGAWEAAVKTDIGNAAIAAETYAAGNNGKYTGLTNTVVGGVNELDDAGFNQSPEVTLNVTPALNSYTITAFHASIAGVQWVYDSTTGATVEGTR